MDGTPILGAAWPPDLDAATVPFKVRTETVLRRAGLYDDPTRFDRLTEAEVLGWWNAGPATVADLRFTGKRAIRRHREEADLRSHMNIDLATVAAEPWAAHIWHRDPRFARYIPKVDATVEEATDRPTPPSTASPSLNSASTPTPKPSSPDESKPDQHDEKPSASSNANSLTSSTEPSSTTPNKPH